MCIKDQAHYETDRTEIEFMEYIKNSVIGEFAENSITFELMPNSLRIHSKFNHRRIV